MSAEELEAACRKCLRMTVTDTAALARVLDEMGIDYKIVDNENADVYAKPNLSQLTLALLKENCEIISSTERDENLESFFISLVGGGSNE